MVDTTILIQGCILTQSFHVSVLSLGIHVTPDFLCPSTENTLS